MLSAGKRSGLDLLSAIAESALSLEARDARATQGFFLRVRNVQYVREVQDLELLATLAESYAEDVEDRFSVEA